jgi:hypothetical protein
MERVRHVEHYHLQRDSNAEFQQMVGSAVTMAIANSVWVLCELRSSCTRRSRSGSWRACTLRARHATDLHHPGGSFDTVVAWEALLLTGQVRMRARQWEREPVGCGV